jgi:two-component system sensor histidine kinase/response regulator
LNKQAERRDTAGGRRSNQRVLELERDVIELTEANRELKSFGAIALHDLMQPMQATFGFLAMLEDGRASGPEQVAEWSGHALRSLRRMHAMLESLAERSSAGAKVLRLERVDCRVVVSEILDDLAPLIAACGGTVHVSRLPHVVADPVQLGELFQNLIANALKFVAVGARAVVRVRATRDGSSWRFAVEDNGIGIPEASLDEVFEPFRRLSNEGEYAGSGLGLYTCRRIVERHGGSIWAERLDPSGTRICFTIPDLAERPAD